MTPDWQAEAAHWRKRYDDLRSDYLEAWAMCMALRDMVNEKAAAEVERVRIEAGVE